MSNEIMKRTNLVDVDFKFINNVRKQRVIIGTK